MGFSTDPDVAPKFRFSLILPDCLIFKFSNRLILNIFVLISE